MSRIMHPVVAPSSPVIRPFEPADLQQIISLRCRLFGNTRERSADAAERYYRKIFFESPWHDPELPSLVYEDGGEILGFLGVIPRPVAYGAERLRGVILSQFMVDPRHRRLAPIQLLKRAVSGPQDLAIADSATAAALKLWRHIGGHLASVYRFGWMQPLRMTQLGSIAIRGALPERMLRGATRVLARQVDEWAMRVGRHPLTGFGDGVTAVPMHPGQSEESLQNMAASFPLYMDYGVSGFSWMLERAREKWGDTSLRAALLQADDGRTIGCYIYTIAVDERAWVIYALALPEYREVLAKHLLYSALCAGAASIQGRYESCLMPAMEGLGVRYTAQGSGVLVHARDETALRTVLSGEALLTGLDVEWILDF